MRPQECYASSTTRRLSTSTPTTVPASKHCLSCPLTPGAGPQAPGGCSKACGSEVRGGRVLGEEAVLGRLIAGVVRDLRDLSVGDGKYLHFTGIEGTASAVALNVDHGEHLVPGGGDRLRLDLDVARETLNGR